ncbi:frizzled-9-like [Amphiura filiformis]|uniref:frizzled-9-like n=1 Tax=Amphiura filiformis TaxID=82378 RepID=UPI003B20ED92
MEPRWWIYILVFSNACFIACCTALQQPSRQGQCERITIQMCVGIGYNMTRMPNFFGHTSQSEAAPLIHEFMPLVHYGCHDHLLFFLCSLYAPMCSEQVDMIIPACRPMCEDVRASCAPVMERFDFRWPESMDCSKLPRSKDRSNLCMVAPNTSENVPDGTDYPGRQPENAAGRPQDEPPPPTQSPTNEHCDNPDRFVYLVQTNSCAPRCDRDVYFQQNDKDFAMLWIGIWSVLCFICTTLTVLTFLIDRARFKYPERPIIFISMCYMMYSIAYIIRLITAKIGPIIACDRTPKPDNELFLIQEGLESTGCTIVFLIQYYFYMASSIWWVVLTISWFLSAGMKWGYEAIAAYSSYYHLVAWALPALKTIIVLTLRRMDGDELTGMCYVGNQDIGALTGFVLAPLFIYFAIGTLFIVSGFVYMFRIRKVMKSGGTNIDKLEKLMVRIGVFSVLYTVPATCVIACYFYQRANMLYWEVAAKLNRCRPNGDCIMDFSIPSVPVLLVKTFMQLVVGITCAMWVCSTKTVQSWHEFFSRMIGSPQRKTAVAISTNYPPAPTQSSNSMLNKLKYTRTPTKIPPSVPESTVGGASSMNGTGAIV